MYVHFCLQTLFFYAVCCHCGFVKLKFMRKRLYVNAPNDHTRLYMHFKISFVFYMYSSSPVRLQRLWQTKIGTQKHTNTHDPCSERVLNFIDRYKRLFVLCRCAVISINKHKWWLIYFHKQILNMYFKIDAFALSLSLFHHYSLVHQFDSLVCILSHNRFLSLKCIMF